MKKAPLKSVILVILIFLAIAGPTDTKKAFGQQPLGSRPELDALAPILGNYPDKSLALSSNMTIAPDAAPTNTTSISVFTSTEFKGRLEGYPATGVVRVTDAHPAGIYTVTVRAFDSGGASAIKTFTLTVATLAACVRVRFAAANFAAGSYSFPVSAAVGDFNGDGKQDLAVANYGLSTVSISLGDGAGGFGPRTNFAAGVGPYSVAVGDFNGDGKQDVIVGNNNSNNISILLGDGTGNFSAATNFAAGSGPVSVAVGDFNGDSKQDLAVANSLSTNVSILLGNGAGGFSAPTNFAAGSYPTSVAVGDFNGEGKPDLAIANAGFNSVSILLGDGAGGFSAPTYPAVGSEPYSVAVGDFNGDGQQDLAVANRGPGTVSILLGNGMGSFSAATNFAAGTRTTSVAVGDFNGDGNQDLAAANLISNNVSILLGNGDGSFSAATNFASGNEPISVVVGDFNGDGQQDLAMANNGSGTGDGDASVLLRVCALTVTGTASRKTHGSAGIFDIVLPLTDSPGIECRTTGGTNDYTIVAAFSGPITVTGSPQAQITSGTGCVGSAGTCSANGTVTIIGNTVTTPLTNVANAQTISVTLNSVSGIGNVVIPVRVLAGDVNENGAVNAGDVSLVKARLGQTVDATNFRADVNASVGINGTDVSIVKANIGTGVF